MVELPVLGDDDMPQADATTDATTDTLDATTAAARLHEQNMAQLGAVGIVAQQGFTTVAKAFDYNYLQGKDMVSLTEALGAREVGSEVNPGGPRKPGT
jgi:hypothetical protein